MGRNLSYLFSRAYEGAEKAIDGYRPYINSTWFKGETNYQIEGMDKETTSAYVTDVIERLVLFQWMIKNSQKFYFPNDVTLLKEKKYTRDLKKYLKLPFESVVIVSEGSFIDGPECQRLHHRFVCALSVNFDFLNYNAPEDRVRFDHDISKWVKSGSIGKNAILVFNVDLLPTETGDTKNVISMFPGSIIMDPDKTEDNYIQYALSYSVNDKNLIYKNLSSGWSLLSNFLVMLNLKNTRTETIEAPKALNKSRIKKGRAPLYSYKVLNVDGETWNGPHQSHGTGKGIRSHLRRGHIRRLDEDRHVWVRATYVHGSVPGFVAKDYNVVA